MGRDAVGLSCGGHGSDTVCVSEAWAWLAEEESSGDLIIGIYDVQGEPAASKTIDAVSQGVPSQANDDIRGEGCFVL